MRNQHGQVWLNVASSLEVLPDYLNLDNSLYFRLEPLAPALRFVLNSERVRLIDRFLEAKRRAPVMLHDCRKPLPFPDGSVDHVLCSHFLEHVYPDEAERILADFFRVLRNEGTVHVIVPNLDHVVRSYVDGTRGADDVLEWTTLSSSRRPSFTFRLLEFLGYEGLKHRWMYDQTTIAERVTRAGFEAADLSAVPSRSIRSEDGTESIHVVARKVAPRK
jgi:predicted SAM-dependent methyltransferase